MTTVPTPRESPLRERRLLAEVLRIPELWASIAIATMWIAVLFDSIYGPDLVSSNGAGTNSTTIPSSIAVALFAFLATWSVAKYAFGRSER
jgi:hypothetical protein